MCLCACAGAFKSVCADGRVHEDIHFDALLRALLSESSTQKLEHIDTIFQKLLVPEPFFPSAALDTGARLRDPGSACLVCFAGGRGCGVRMHRIRARGRLRGGLTY